MNVVKLTYEPEEVATLFGKSVRWVHRHACAPIVAPDGTVIRAAGPLFPYVRRIGRSVFFVRAAIDDLIQNGT